MDLPLDPVRRESCVLDGLPDVLFGDLGVRRQLDRGLSLPEVDPSCRGPWQLPQVLFEPVDAEGTGEAVKAITYGFVDENQTSVGSFGA